MKEGEEDEEEEETVIDDDSRVGCVSSADDP